MSTEINSMSRGPSGRGQTHCLALLTPLTTDHAMTHDSLLTLRSSDVDVADHLYIGERSWNQERDSTGEAMPSTLQFPSFSPPCFPLSTRDVDHPSLALRRRHQRRRWSVFLHCCSRDAQTTNAIDGHSLMRGCSCAR